MILMVCSKPFSKSTPRSHLQLVKIFARKSISKSSPLSLWQLILILGSGLQEAVADLLTFTTQTTSILDYLGQVGLIFIITSITKMILIVIVPTARAFPPPSLTTRPTRSWSSISMTTGAVGNGKRWKKQNYCLNNRHHFILPIIDIFTARYNMSLRELAENKMIFDDELEQVKLG